VDLGSSWGARTMRASVLDGPVYIVLYRLVLNEEVTMRKINVVNHVTLDGVMQAPADPEEDTRGGFEHGGWAVADNDEVMARKMAEHMSGGDGALLLGRRTYEHFYGFWPHQTDNPFTEVLNRARKYVASTTLSEPLEWENSTLLDGDVPEAVTELKRQDGPDMVVLGSGELIHTLWRTT
jgi:dihydrofolate reductase